MLLHLQVYIKESIIFSAQTQVVGKDLGLSTLKMKKDLDIHNQRPFFVFKMKIPKKWLPLRDKALISRDAAFNLS